MTEYLTSFFKTIATLSERSGCDVSDAIAYRDGALCVLISMGDVRARVPVNDLHPDPVQAARLVVDRWRSMSKEELWKSMEEVR